MSSKTLNSFAQQNKKKSKKRFSSSKYLIPRIIILSSLLIDVILVGIFVYSYFFAKLFTLSNDWYAVGVICFFVLLSLGSKLFTIFGTDKMLEIKSTIFATLPKTNILSNTTKRVSKFDIFGKTPNWSHPFVWLGAVIVMLLWMGLTYLYFMLYVIYLMLVFVFLTLLTGGSVLIEWPINFFIKSKIHVHSSGSSYKGPYYK